MRGRRKRNLFTEEERSILLSNKYTYSVTEANIFYTVEFKKHFWKKYNSGETVKSIFLLCGYDIDILGEGRIYNFAQKLSKDMETGGLQIESNSKENKTNKLKSDKEKMKNLETEIEYLRQENEFLKKTLSAQNQKKRK